MGLEKDPSNVKCRRMVTQAMKDVVDRGKLLYFSSETHQTIDWTFNVDLIDKACEVIEANIGILDESRRSTFETGYENFLKDCVHSLYASNRKKKAKEYALKLMKRYPGKNLKYKDLHKIMTQEIAENISSMSEDQTRQIIMSYVDNSMQQYALYENDERALYWWSQVKYVYEYWYEKTKKRIGRQGPTRSFYEMGESVLKLNVNRFPSRRTAMTSYFERMMKGEARTLKEYKALKNKQK
jgi:hypothetical protein